MDDNVKHASSYQVDQEILEARGISMTVEEVAGLPTCKYSERVRSLKLSTEDLAFLKGLRRRIKNRNSRRRSVEHLRRLTRELRAVRACRNDALADRRALALRRDTVRDKCASLRRHILQILQERSDTTEVPSIEVELPPLPPKSITIGKKINGTLSHPVLSECLKGKIQIKEEVEEIVFDEDEIYERVREELEREQMQNKELIRDMSLNRQSHEDCINETRNSDRGINVTIKKEIDANVFECKIGKLVQQSVNHIFNDKKKVFAKTVFIANDKLTSNVKSISIDNVTIDNVSIDKALTIDQEEGVLNLSVKEGRRKSHGRKQSAPRRITLPRFNDDGVLDLKIKKESQ